MNGNLGMRDRDRFVPALLFMWLSALPRGVGTRKLVRFVKISHRLMAQGGELAKRNQLSKTVQ